jgi:biotin carboxylase
MLAGSRGVIRANNREQFIAAINTLRHIVSNEQAEPFEKQHFLVEQYLDGEEIALDGFMQNGKLIPLALFDKPEPLTGPYFEESYYITPSQKSVKQQREIIREIERCCKSYGLRQGPVHAEARITGQGVVLIEMASRTIGGQCARLIDEVLGIPLEDIVIRLTAQDRVELSENNGYAGVLMIPITKTGVLKRIEGLTAANQVEYIQDIEIHIQPGYELIPLPEGSSYLGFIFAKSPGYEQTYQALKTAYHQLEFVTSPKWQIELPH